MSVSLPTPESTPLDLLCIQEECFKIMDASKESARSFEYAEALALLDHVNMELTSRGRCTRCGLRHNVTECHRVHSRRLEE